MNMMRWIGIAGVIGLAAGVGGCEMDNMLTHRQAVPRAELGLENIAAPAIVEREGGGPIEPGTPGAVEDKIVGTYTFTVPKTVTQVKQTGPSVVMYLLYASPMAPTDKPMVSLEIGPDVTALAAAETTDMKVQKNRLYSLNGLRAEEWTGYTAAGQPFCELIVEHPGSGDKLHGIAVAKDEGVRKAALEILGSITWKAAK